MSSRQTENYNVNIENVMYTTIWQFKLSIQNSAFGKSKILNSPSTVSTQQDFLTDLGVYFHGEEESEVGMGREGVQFLLQLHQPLWGQVHVLQQHPATCLGG